MKTNVQMFIMDAYAQSEIGWRQAADELGIWELEEFELMLERNNIVRQNKLEAQEMADIQNFARLFSYENSNGGASDN